MILASRILKSWLVACTLQQPRLYFEMRLPRSCLLWQGLPRLPNFIFKDSLRWAAADLGDLVSEFLAQIAKKKGLLKSSNPLWFKKDG